MLQGTAAVRGSNNDKIDNKVKGGHYDGGSQRAQRRRSFHPAGAWQSPPASAETYPAHPIRLVVPFAAAGPTDVIARIVAQKLSDVWGQQLYIENVPGAGGNTGIGMVAKAAPDGYTILVVSTGFIVNPSMYAKLPYDPIKDFSPITLVAASPNVVSSHPSVPAKGLNDLVALIKANPGKYSFAHPATGSTPHLAGELFKQKYGLDLVTVPFNGAGSGHQFHHRRPHTDCLHGAASRHEQHQGRKASRDCGAEHPALTVRAGRADKHRSRRARSRKRYAYRHCRPRGHAGRRSSSAGTAPSCRWSRCPISRKGWRPWALLLSRIRRKSSGERLKSEMAKWSKVVHDANIRAD